MPFSSSRLTLPPGFPDDQFEEIKDRILAKVPKAPRELVEGIAGGHNAVRFRLRACADYSEELIESINRVGIAPPLEERYHQERKLFGFFVSGIATLDSFSYFLHFTAAQINPAAFLIHGPRHLRRIDLNKTATSFGLHFTDEPLSIALTTIAHDPMFQRWAGYRNVLAHRSAPGRHIYLGGPNDRTAEWKIDLAQSPALDATLTLPRLAWLVSTLANLVATTAKFVAKNF